MAIFKEPTQNNDKKSIKTTFISDGMEVSGNFKGEGALQVEGILHGDIHVTSVVIGENGVVNGNIYTKNSIINGKLNGSIKSDALEIMKNGVVSNKINVKSLKVTGRVEGEVVVAGLLEIESTGYVSGNISIKNIKTHEGGRILGSMQQYQEPVVQEEKEPQVTETV